MPWIELYSSWDIIFSKLKHNPWHGDIPQTKAQSMAWRAI
jgi:hypothetical protein